MQNFQKIIIIPNMARRAHLTPLLYPAVNSIQFSSQQEDVMTTKSNLPKEPPALQEQVIAFVSTQMGEPSENLTLTTRLNHDLGLEGDDAEWFLLDFSKRFKVDFADFDFSNYFLPENPLKTLFLFLPSLRALLKAPLPEYSDEDNKSIPITIEDLINAAKQRRWATK
jgi:hypothetical protein